MASSFRSDPRRKSRDALKNVRRAVRDRPTSLVCVQRPATDLTVSPLRRYGGMSKRVAILTPAFGANGGLTSVALFLFNAIRDHSADEAMIVSVSTSRLDAASRCALRPSSWHNRPTVIRSVHEGIPFVHVGAVLAEIEAARYWPHKTLTRILMKSDVVLVVSGTPVWARLAKEANRPIVLFMASF